MGTRCLGAFWLAGVVSVLLAAPALAQRAAVDSAQTLMRAAIQAYQEEAYPVFLEKTRAAESLRPGHPGLTYNLAAAYARNGQSEQALAMLQRYADMGLVARPEEDSDFEPIRNDPRFSDILRQIAHSAEPVGEAEEAFRLADPAFIPEGIAYDAPRDAFYVGSVHTRRIVRVDAQGVQVFADSTDGLWSVLGIAVDAERRHLWACSAALEQTRHVSEAEKGKTALFLFDLDTGTGLRTYALPAAETPQVLGDLVLSAGGKVYVTDGRSGAIYSADPGRTTLQEVLTPGRLVSPQGLVLLEDEQRLLVADYSLGLVSVDLATKVVDVLEPPPHTTLLGIDGLARYGNTLLAIQNGVRPHRVLQIHLNETHDQLVSAEVLTANLPAHDEPTLGTVVGDMFYYLGNSQWGRFRRDGSLPPAAELTAPIILKVAL